MTDSLAATASRLEALLHGAGAQVRRDSESAARALVGALSEASAAAGERITSAGGQIAAAVSQVGDGLAGTLEPILATLGGFRESLHALDGRFVAQSAQINDSVERMQGLAVQLERAATELRNAGTPIAGTAQRFETAGNRIDEAAGSFGDTQRRLAEGSTLLQQSVAEDNAAWEEYARRFEHADEQLGKVVKTLVEGADAYQQGIAKYVRQIDERLAHGVAQFGGAISELAEAIEELGTGMTPVVASELSRPAGPGRVTAGSRRT